ncbi:MAG: hypothetical protein NT160_01830 [Actinobacteria bacterium]|nr:hypothetical protein [Actinomycetota bacterium]
MLPGLEIELAGLDVASGKDLNRAIVFCEERKAARIWLLGTRQRDVIALCAAVASSCELPLGVMLPLNREPAILARELTTLDHLCPFGLAVALRLEQGEEARIEEYFEVLRTMFVQSESSMDIGESHLRHAPNRPGPITPGGPDLYLDLRAMAAVDPGLIPSHCAGLVELFADGSPQLGGRALVEIDLSQGIATLGSME